MVVARLVGMPVMVLTIAGCPVRAPQVDAQLNALLSAALVAAIRQRSWSVC